MRKITLLLACLLMCNVPIYAQKAHQLDIIPVLGGNLGLVRIPGLPVSPRYGIYAGLNVQYSLTEKFLIGAGLLYSQKGFTTDLSFIDANGNFITNSKVTFRANFVETPLYLGVPFKISDKFTLLPTLALNTGIYLHGGVKINNLKTQSTSNTRGIAYDVGTVLSVAGIFNGGKNPILVALRYNPSFRDDSYLLGMNMGIMF